MWPPFLETFFLDQLDLLRFPDVARSRIRSVNRSPLGAASQLITDSLSFLLRVCAPEVKKKFQNCKTKKRCNAENNFVCQIRND